MEELKFKGYDEYIKIAEEKLFELYKDDMVKLSDSKEQVHIVAQTLVNVDLKNKLEELVSILLKEKETKPLTEVEKPVTKQAPNKSKK